MSSKNRLILFLIELLITFENNITAFFIVASLIKGYIFILSINAVATSSLFIPISSSLSFWSDDWKIMTCGQFAFGLFKIFFIPRYPTLENVVLKFITGITNLVGNPPLSYIFLWYFIENFGSRITCIVSNGHTIFLLVLIDTTSSSLLVYLIHQKGWSLSGGDQCWPPSRYIFNTFISMYIAYRIHRNNIPNPFPCQK